MAPTSATKKKASAATKRKFAKKKTTTTKAAKKNAPLVSRKRKKPPQAQAPIPVLPEDWPVATRPPTFSSEASALRPGSLLQQTCSGNDIQLARSACVVPNFEKSKGKFLLMFPGNFSFGELAAESNTAEDEKPKASNGDVKQEETASKKQPATSMGRIEGLKTNNPSFRIPFPHLQKSLVFPGKKLSTTSKFLALSCSNKKSGTVQCKNIFSSAVVFGMPKWESNKDGTVVSTPISTAKTPMVSPPASAEPQSSSKDTKPPATEIDSDDDDKKPKRPFLHYGGSERTVDGATRSSRKSNNKNTVDVSNGNTSNERIPIFSTYSNNDSNDGPSSAFDFSNNNALKPSQQAKPAPKTAKSYDTSSDDDVVLSSSDDSDGEYNAKLSDLTGSATKTRLPPRRQASMTKKKYVEDDDEEEEESEEDSEKSEKESSLKNRNKNKTKETPKKKGASKTTKTPKKEAPQKKTATKAKSSTKKRTVAKKEVIELNDNDDSSSYGSETLDKTKKAAASNTSNAQRRSAPRRKSTTQKKAVYKEESDIEENDEESDDSEKENASHSSEDSAERKSKAAKSKKKSTPSAVARTPSSSKRKAAPKTSAKAFASKRPRNSTSTTNTSNRTSKAASLLEKASTPSPKSPFRRRHKKKSPAKKSRSQQRVLDLTQDDEFTFG